MHIPWIDRLLLVAIVITCLAGVTPAVLATSSSPGGLIARADTAFAQRFIPDEMRAAIAYYEQSLPVIPTQSQAYVLDRLAQCYYELTTFSPGDTATDKELFAKGEGYGLRSLRLNPAFARLEKDNFASAVSHITDPAALLWTANNWGALFHYDPLQGLVDAAKVKALYERGIKIDETYWGASFDNALGAMLVTLPVFLGGDPDKGEALLKRAVSLAPDYLENRVVYAQYWGFTYDMLGKVNGIRDADLINHQVNYVLAAPIGKWPFWNREAKKEAKILLQLETATAHQ